MRLYRNCYRVDWWLKPDTLGKVSLVCSLTNADVLIPVQQVEQNAYLWHFNLLAFGDITTDIVLEPIFKLLIIFCVQTYPIYICTICSFLADFNYILPFPDFSTASLHVNLQKLADSPLNFAQYRDPIWQPVLCTMC